MGVKIDKYLVIGIFIVITLIVPQVISQPISITIKDYISYNFTHNATTNLEYPLESADHASYMPIIIGDIIISNNALEDIFDLNITLNNTANLTALPVYNPSQSDVKGFVLDLESWNHVDGGNILLRVPDLPKDGTIVFSYVVNASEVNEPVNITKNVSTILGSGRVFNNELFNVSVTLKNNLPDSTISANFTDFAVNGFAFSNGTGFTKATQGSISFIGSNETIAWQNVILDNFNSLSQFDFSILSPNSTTVAEDDDDYNQRKNYVNMFYGYGELSFSANNSILPMEVESVTARPRAGLTVTKERTDGFDWQTIPRFENPTSDLYYRLEKFSVWAIPSDNSAMALDPGRRDNWMPNSYFQWNISSNPETFGSEGVILDYNSAWTNSSGLTFFNDSHVPVVFGRAEFSLVDNSSMVERNFSSVNISQQYTYHEKILFMYGYFLEAEKTVVNLPGMGMFRVRVKLTNRGNGDTPNSTLLADTIPPNMNITFSNGTISDSGITINSTDSGKDYLVQGNGGLLWARYGGQNFTGKSPASGAFNGYWTYFWELTSLKAGETIILEYYLNGTDTYYPGQLYMIGVDPVKTNRIASSKSIITADGFNLPEKSQENVAIPFSLSLFLISVFTLKQKRK